MPGQLRVPRVASVAAAPKGDPSSGHTFLSSSILFRSSKDWQPLPSRILREACTRVEGTQGVVEGGGDCWGLLLLLLMGASVELGGLRLTCGMACRQGPCCCL